MNFAQLKSFYLAATLGTFGLAAKRLNATQPAISSRIAALEQQLGVKLFDRTGLVAVSKQVEAIADRVDAARRLMSIPGIGPLGATALLAAIGDCR